MTLLFRCGVALAACTVAAHAAECPFGGSAATYTTVPAPTTEASGEQKTVNGCTCIEKCGTSVSDLFKCETCYTKDNCGTVGLFGRSWDYCAVPKAEAFEELSYDQKMDYFWSKTTKACGDVEDLNPKDQKRRTSKRRIRTVMSSSTMSFDNMRDELPPYRRKTFHVKGAVCKFTQKTPDGSPFTGLFAGGEKVGILRLAPAAADGIGAIGPSPGIGVKFPITGQMSANYVAMNAIGFGSKSEPVYDFFQKSISNRIPPIKSNAGIKKFEQASQCPFQVGISNLANFHQDGTKVDEPLSPYKLLLVPTMVARDTQSKVKKSETELMAEFHDIPVGTPLYKVYGCSKPGQHERFFPTGNNGASLAEVCNGAVDLGDLVTSSPCGSSSYGDEELFFRHQRAEEDWIANPDVHPQQNRIDTCSLEQRQLEEKVLDSDVCSQGDDDDDDDEITIWMS